MLRIKINEAFIDLGETTIGINLKGPLFSDNSIQGGYSFPFAVPASIRNKAILGYPGKMGVQNVPRVFDFELYHSGMLLFIGSASVDYNEGSNINIILKVGGGDISEALNTQFLDEMDLGGIREYEKSNSSQPNSILKVCQGAFPDFDFAYFPVYNEDFFTDTLYAPTWNNINVNTDGPYQNAWNISGPSPIIYTPGKVVTPFPYTGYVLKQIFESNNYRMLKNIFRQDEDLRRLCIFNTFYVTHNIASPPVYQLDLKNNVPHITASDLIVSLKNTFNLGFFFNIFNRELQITTIDEVLKSTEIVDFSSKAVITKMYSLPENQGFKFSFSPDTEDQYWSEKNPEVDFSKYTVLAPVAHSSALPTPDRIGLLCYVEEGNELWSTLLTNGSTVIWQFLSSYYPPYVHGEGKKEVKPNIGVLYNEHHVAYQGSSPHISTPIVRQKAFKDSTYNRNTFSLRMLFYRGFFDFMLDYVYPLGTSFNYADWIRPVTDAKYSLWWGGDNQIVGDYGVKGLWQNFWRDWIYYRENISRKVEIIKVLTAAELRTLDFSKKHRVAGDNYFLDEVQITLTNRQILPATIIAYKV